MGAGSDEKVKEELKLSHYRRNIGQGDDGIRET